MILVRNKEGELLLVGNQSIDSYDDCEIIKVYNNLPPALRRFKVTDKLPDIISKQQGLLERAEEEVETRKECLVILEEMARLGAK